MFSINPNADPVLPIRYGAPECSRLHGVPLASRWNFLPEDPLVGAALLLTNQAVASNVPFAAEMPASLVLPARYTIALSFYPGPLQLIAVKYPIGKASNTFYLS
jgi:hypothetical protein